MTLMMMHLNDPVPDVRGFRPDIHPEIVAIIQKCLAKDRNDRYQSAAELSRDLRRALAYVGGPPTSVGIKTTTAPAPAVGASHPQPMPSNAYTTEYQPARPVHPAPNVTTVAPPPPGRSTHSRSMPWIIGAALAITFCIALVLILGNAVLSGGLFQQAATPTEPLSVHTSTSPATEPAVPLASESLPVETPTETSVPPTPTPTGLVITNIRLESNLYVVDYEVHNFPESPSLHVHMFFNTVPPEQAGSPASGPWKLTWGVYGDPPFTQYGPANRPANATQLCALVANPNHSVILQTGNCVDLPQ